MIARSWPIVGSLESGLDEEEETVEVDKVDGVGLEGREALIVR